MNIKTFRNSRVSSNSISQREKLNSVKSHHVGSIAKRSTSTNSIPSLKIAPFKLQMNTNKLRTKSHFDRKISIKDFNTSELKKPQTLKRNFNVFNAFRSFKFLLRMILSRFNHKVTPNSPRSIQTTCLGS